MSMLSEVQIRSLLTPRDSEQDREAARQNEQREKEPTT